MKPAYDLQRIIMYQCFTFLNHKVMCERFPVDIEDNLWYLGLQLSMGTT